MLKFIIGVVIVALVAIGGYYAWQAYGASPAAPAPEPQIPVTNTYATSTFSITYPSSYWVDDEYAYDGFEKKPIAGVRFGIPGAMATGTNLSTDTSVSVEWLPRASKCTGDIFVVPNVKATSLTVGSTTFSVASTSGAAAGNMYEEMVYAIAESKPCTAVRYFIHSTDIGNYDSVTVRTFDHAALLREFDTIRNSLQLNTR